MLNRCLLLLSLVVCLPAIAGAKADRVILGYSAVWRDSANPPSQYNYQGLTYIARSFLKPMPDGSVVVPDGYFNTDLESLAHRHGVKLLMSIGGGGVGTSKWLAMVGDEKARQRFLDTLRQLMEQHHYDGIDIDWEPADPTEADGKSQAILLGALRKSFPRAVLTTALPTDVYSTRFILFPQVLANVNYVNAMAYDYSGPWSGIAGHASNLFPAGDYPAQPGRSVQEGMATLIGLHHVPPRQLLMGVTFWAYRFRVNHIGEKFTANANDTVDDLSYQQCLNLVQSGHYESRLDQKAGNRYLERTGGGSVVCYETPESIGRKCAYAMELDCAGVMIWGLGSDMTGAQCPLMDAITKSFGSTPPQLGRVGLQAEILDTKEMIEQEHPIGNIPAVPVDLSALSMEQLESLNGELQHCEGAANDAYWQNKAATHRQ